MLEMNSVRHYFTFSLLLYKIPVLLIKSSLAKSKKVRRKVAKAARKAEEKVRLSGIIIEPKIPITKQSIDLPSNETGTAEGALEAERTRGELRSGMRRERRSNIKEKNFLKSM